MMDTTVLSLVLRDGKNPPLDPNTGKKLYKPKERVQHLLDSLSGTSTKIVVPAPIVTEMLENLGVTAAAYVKHMQQSPHYEIQPFGVRAALELSEINRHFYKSGKKKGGSVESWSKIKFDRQIVAIAKVSKVETIYCDDKGMANYAYEAGFDVVRSWELPVPPEDPQTDMFEKSEEG